MSKNVKMDVKSLNLENYLIELIKNLLVRFRFVTGELLVFFIESRVDINIVL